MKTPKIHLKELQEANFKDRLDFINKYTKWLKKTPNKEWSSEQKEII